MNLEEQNKKRDAFWEKYWRSTWEELKPNRKGDFDRTSFSYPEILLLSMENMARKIDVKGYDPKSARELTQAIAEFNVLAKENPEILKEERVRVFTSIVVSNALSGLGGNKMVISPIDEEFNESKRIASVLGNVGVQPAVDKNNQTPLTQLLKRQYNDYHGNVFVPIDRKKFAAISLNSTGDKVLGEQMKFWLENNFEVRDVDLYYAHKLVEDGKLDKNIYFAMKKNNEDFFGADKSEKNQGMQTIKGVGEVPIGLIAKENVEQKQKNKETKVDLNSFDDKKKQHALKLYQAIRKKRGSFLEDVGQVIDNANKRHFGGKSSLLKTLSNAAQKMGAEGEIRDKEEMLRKLKNNRLFKNKYDR